MRMDGVLMSRGQRKTAFQINWGQGTRRTIAGNERSLREVSPVQMQQYYPDLCSPLP